MKPLHFFALFTWFVAAFPAAHASDVIVTDAASFRQALASLGPGVVLKLQPGEYGNGYHITSKSGTAAAPWVIEAADPARPPRFSGGKGGLQISGCSHLVLRKLVVQGQSINGLNVDDGGGEAAHHILLEDLDVHDIGPKGNFDGIKLSGLEDFEVRRCTVSGWGGQAVDMVGCHRGVIAECRFEGKAGYSQSTGVQAKGGSEDIVVRSCTFLRGGERGVNLGGSTGRPYFRPREANYEARRITVEGCLFVGGITPVAFVGVEEGVVRFNTMVNPEFWALRILQENQEAGMVPCSRSRFENNVIHVQEGKLRAWINIGPGTQPESFVFANNWWYDANSSQPPQPKLPTAERGGSYGMDPELDPADGYRPRKQAAQRFGHTAFTKPAKP